MCGSRRAILGHGHCLLPLRSVVCERCHLPHEKDPNDIQSCDVYYSALQPDPDRKWQILLGIQRKGNLRVWNNFVLVNYTRYI